MPLLLKCSKCAGPTDRVVDGEVLCVFCEDGVENPAAPKKVAFDSAFVERRMREHKNYKAPEKQITAAKVAEREELPMKIRKAEEGERACACGNRLRSDNSTGVCTPCRRAGDVPRAPKAPKKQRVPKVLCNRDANLNTAIADRLWAVLTNDEKMSIVRKLLAE